MGTFDWKRLWAWLAECGAVHCIYDASEIRPTAKSSAEKQILLGRRGSGSR